MDESVLARGGDPPEPPVMPPSTAGEPVVAASPADGRSAGWRSPWLVAGGLLLILVLLTLSVLTDGPLVGADQRIRDAVRAQATSASWRWLSDSWHAPAQLLTDLGNYEVAIPVLAACALIAAARHRTPRPLLAALAAVVLVVATVTPAKILIGRTGPGLTTLGSGGLGVFPSGHTTTASVALGVALLLLLPDLPARIRPAAVVAVAGLCFLVGAALVWCDYHWFTDVVAGWALAGLIVQASLRLSECSRARWSQTPWGRGRG